MVKKIKEEIEREGAISFERFMEMALYFPGYGYYMKESSPWGEKGDYYTGPQLHRFFGAVVAVQIKEFWDLMGRPEKFVVVEGGPGDGTLAFDLLSYLRDYEENLFFRLFYILLERNPYLEMVQREKLKDFKNLLWFRDLTGLPEFSGVFISNELFDSFPVKRVKMEDDLKEIYVTLNLDKFTEITKPAEKDVKEYFSRFSVSLKKGFVTEVCLKMRDFVEKLSFKLKEGFVYTIDYGYTAKEYFADERSKGTLLCYYKHTFHENPYINIGDQDITAHVNFSALQIWGEESNLRTIGFAPLGTYIVSLGIEGALEKVFKMGLFLKDFLKIKNFLVSQGFGESHKVLVQSKGIEPQVLKGFLLRNKRDSL